MAFRFNHFGANHNRSERPLTPNPDRVKMEEERHTVTEIIPEKVDFVRETHIQESSPLWAMRFIRPEGDRVRAVVGVTAVAAALGLAATNIGNEYTQGGSNERLTEARNVHGALETTDMQTVVQETQREVCSVIDADFMHRFTMRDADGTETFNPGAAIIPFAVGVKENCKAKVDVELHVPYHFARTFKEIATKNPQMRSELVKKLAEFITKEAENQLVIKGIAGVTETTYVWNRKENIIAAGKPVINLGTFNISDFSLEGTASTEAEKTRMHEKVKSLQGFNPENVRLAGKRLQDMRPLIAEALEKSGVDPAVLENAREFTYEHNLVDAEISEIAAISRTVLGGTVKGSEAEEAYALIAEMNKGNTAVLKALNDHPQYAETLNKHITSHRGVNISFSAETEYKKTNVFNVLLPLPLLLFLLPGVEFEKIPGGYQVKTRERVVRTPEEMRTHEEVTEKPVARRLFSEATPATLDKERSFNEIYDEIDLSENSRDTHALLEHMLIEEVLPSLDENTREPLIDYEDAVNKCREFLSSDTRKDGVKKGHYATPEVAQRKLTEELLEIWERHDIATYPMAGIDVKEVINYRDNKDIVYWAKTLAYTLTSLAERTHTRDEFRTLLQEEIRKSLHTRASQGGSDRNIFVVSDFPRT